MDSSGSAKEPVVLESPCRGWLINTPSVRLSSWKLVKHLHFAVGHVLRNKLQGPRLRKRLTGWLQTGIPFSHFCCNLTVHMNDKDIVDEGIWDLLPLIKYGSHIKGKCKETYRMMVILLSNNIETQLVQWLAWGNKRMFIWAELSSRTQDLQTITALSSMLLFL